MKKTETTKMLLNKLLRYGMKWIIIAFLLSAVVYLVYSYSPEPAQSCIYGSETFYTVEEWGYSEAEFIHRGPC